MIFFALHMAGAVALLLWAVRLIRSGVERAFMAQLRNGVRHSGKTPVLAALTGAAAAVALQSSTAVAALIAGFATAGTIAVPMGLAMLLGADFGSSIVARILLAPLTWPVPLLLICGVALHLRAERADLRQFGRILIGLALVFVSLGMIRDSTEPLRQSGFVEVVANYLASDLMASFVIGAALAWVMHSSVAAVLTYVTFLTEGLIGLPVAAALILGANLGGAVIALTLTRLAGAEARRIVFGNFILRGGGALIALAALVLWAPDLTVLGNSPQGQAINLHILFNLAVPLLSLPLIKPLTLALASALPSGSGASNAPQTALDPAARGDPDRALANAAREILRMGELVHEMLSPSMALFEEWDEAIAARIDKQEDQVDRMHFETKLYIARVQEGRLTTEQSRRAMDIVTIANNLEDAGDKISSTLLDLARRMRTEGLAFSKKGQSDLTDFHDRVLSNTQLALNVLMTSDPEAARQLVEEKDRARLAEQTLQVRHLARLRKGNSASIETSNMHQEAVRALKQINSALSFVAYPIVEQAGDLLSTRLSAPQAGNT